MLHAEEGTHRNHGCRTSPFLWQQTSFTEPLLHPVDVGSILVNLQPALQWVSAHDSRKSGSGYQLSACSIAGLKHGARELGIGKGMRIVCQIRGKKHVEPAVYRTNIKELNAQGPH